MVRCQVAHRVGLPGFQYTHSKHTRTPLNKDRAMPHAWDTDTPSARMVSLLVRYGVTVRYQHLALALSVRPATGLCNTVETPSRTNGPTPYPSFLLTPHEWIGTL